MLAIGLPVMVNFIQQYLNGLPDYAISLLGALHVDDCLTMIFSAYAAKLGVRVRSVANVQTSAIRTGLIQPLTGV